MKLKICLVLSLVLAACGSDGGSDSPISKVGDQNCDGNCPNQFLSQADVTKILQQAVAASSQAGVSGTFAVLDRTGNVLAVYQMKGAPETSVINGQVGARGILEGL